MKRVLLVCLLCSCAGRADKTSPGPQTPEPTAAAPAPAAATRPLEKMSLRDVGLDPDRLDRSADPCEDFFQFACGGWVKNTAIPPDQSSWSNFQEVFERNEKILHESAEQAAKAPGDDPVMQKLGTYYTSCMDAAAVEKAGTSALAPLFATTRKVKDVSSLGAAIAELHKNGIAVVFKVSPVQDFKDATKVIADVDQSGLGLPNRDYYLREDDKSKALRVAYVAHVGRTLRLIGRSAAEAKRGAADVMAIELELAKASLSPVEQRDPKAIYNRIDRAGLGKEAPAVGWDRYFQSLGHPDIRDVSVHSIAYLRAMDDLLTEIKAPAWRSYLDFHIADALAPYLPKKLDDERFGMDKLVFGAKEQKPRWKRCLAFIDADLGELLAQPFVKRAFGPESKAAAELMIREVAKAFGDGLSAVAWMDEPTRKKAHQKLGKLEFMIGYPDNWRTYDFPLDKENLAKNTLVATRAEVSRRLAKIGKPMERREFQTTPQSVNAYYDPSLNQMVFLAGILQPPFYAVKSSTAVNLGGMGMVVGHELTHGYDDQGAQFDGDGNLSDWWPDEVAKRFKERTQCVASFYGNYDALPDLKINGALTNGENIADIGGTKNAFRAYHALRRDAKSTQIADGFSEDQQFFLALGQAWCSKESEEFLRFLVTTDPHSPPRFRVNGVVTNLTEFSAAFQCKPGQKMRPEKVCEVW